jgi:hypothetical protein
MTREKAKRLLPILQAFAEGKQIQLGSDRGGWNDCSGHLVFDSDPKYYRVKPEARRVFIRKCSENGVVRVFDTMLEARELADECCTIAEFVEVIK